MPAISPEHVPYVLQYDDEDNQKVTVHFMVLPEVLQQFKDKRASDPELKGYDLSNFLLQRNSFVHRTDGPAVTIEKVGDKNDPLYGRTISQSWYMNGDASCDDKGATGDCFGSARRKTLGIQPL